MSRRRRAALFPVLALTACSALPGGGHDTAPAADWALAVHGGAGTIDRDTPPAKAQEYRDALRAVLELGRERLARGDSALDVCEAVVRVLEDDPHFNAGKGAAFTDDGHHELDACIMDGATQRAGAVAAVRTVKNPIGLARLVMARTPHILLAGDGAEAFATAMGVERVPNEWFDTEARRRALDELHRERARAGGTAMADAGPPAARYGTVGCVARDRQGRLAVATSTGGLTGKRFGRIGDSPLPGAGTWADAFAAVSCTGTGEEFMRHAVARTVSARMEFGGQTLAAAADALVSATLRPDDGGLIAVDRAGHIAMPYNSTGMYRAAADANGRCEVRIWEQ